MTQTPISAPAPTVLPTVQTEPSLALSSEDDKTHFVQRVKNETRGHDKLFRLLGLQGADRNGDRTVSGFEYGLHKVFSAIWDQVPTSWKDSQIHREARSNEDSYDDASDYKEMIGIVDSAFTTQKLHALNVLKRSDADKDGRYSRTEHAGFKLAFAAESWAIKTFPRAIDALAEEIPVRKPE